MTRSEHGPSRRTVLYGLTGGALATAGIGMAGLVPHDDGSHEPREHALKLDAAVTELITSLHRDGPYRHPTDTERDNAVRATQRLLAGAAAGPTAHTYARLGMELADGSDTTGRHCDLLTSANGTPRSWGMLVIDRATAPPHLVVSVPHPRADLKTAHLGLALFRAVPGSALLIAGAHRAAADGAADVAHERQSLFHALSGLLAAHGATQLQLHGYADDSMPDKDIVLSAGAGTPQPRMKHAADDLRAEGFEVCRAWHDDDCDALSGETNVQGRAAAEHDHPFVHLEMSHNIRSSPDDRADMLRVIAETYRRDRPGSTRRRTPTTTDSTR